MSKDELKNPNDERIERIFARIRRVVSAFNDIAIAAGYKGVAINDAALQRHHAHLSFRLYGRACGERGPLLSVYSIDSHSDNIAMSLARTGFRKRRFTREDNFLKFCKGVLKAQTRAEGEIVKLKKTLKSLGRRKHTLEYDFQLAVERMEGVPRSDSLSHTLGPWFELMLQTSYLDEPVESATKTIAKVLNAFRIHQKKVGKIQKEIDEVNQKIKEVQSASTD